MHYTYSGAASHSKSNSLSVCVDVQYSALKEDLESDAQGFEAPTWSLAVDQQFVKNFSKDFVKRQDVIHGKLLLISLSVYLTHRQNKYIECSIQGLKSVC